MCSHTPIRLQHLYFSLPNHKPLFTDLTLAFTQHKTGLVGRNGVGKSTLVKMITGKLHPTSGAIQTEGTIGYVPQNPVINPNATIAAVLGFDEKLQALTRIKNGSIDETDFVLLNDAWNIEEQLQNQLALFGLDHFSYTRNLQSLSGGEITRLLLTNAFCSDVDFLVLDEPTNHLDSTARKQLYTAIQHWSHGMIVVSHDRTLLNLMDEIVELNTLGADCYGGNYAFYTEQKKIEKDARELALHDAKKLLEKTKQSIQGSREKHAQKQSYGLKLKESGSIDKMAAGSKKGRSERTQSTLLIKEERLLHQAETKIKTAREKIEITDVIDIALPNTYVPNGKIIINMDDITFGYPNTDYPIIKNFSLIIRGAERIAFSGANGSGKTTLVKLFLGELVAQQGKIYTGTEHVRYLDQTTSLLNAEVSILENFLSINPEATEYEAYLGLAQFLFKNVTALKLVKDLSGGEKLRALLACVLLSKTPPQLLILDEPTNHLDLSSIQNVESALKHYEGALIVISHDQVFLENIGINRIIHL